MERRSEYKCMNENEKTVIYYNGVILTMDEANPQAQAVSVQNGRIRKIGTDEEVLSENGFDTVCIDLQGKTMLPGFIDGHSHFSGLATSLSQCDLSKAENFADIERLLKEFIRKNEIPKGHWVTGVNYDHNFLTEKRHPDKILLDRVSTDHPIVIVHASSHMGVANSMGLLQQGITDATKDPQGGRYGRMEEFQECHNEMQNQKMQNQNCCGDGEKKEGEPNGYMEENAFVQFRNRMPMPDIEDIMQQFVQAQEIYAGYGITTMQEGMVTPPLYGILQYAAERDIFYLDLSGYLDLESSDEASLKKAEDFGSYRKHLKMGGCKIFLDGSPQGRTAWMLTPYEPEKEGDDDYCGYPVKTDEHLHELLEKAMRRHLQVLAHCNGDAAAQQYITQFEKVCEEHPGYELHRPVMVHAQLVREEQLARMKKLTMMPSFFVAHTYYWGDIHIRNFGMERAKKISPAGTAQKMGIPFTFHQDSPVLPPDVFQTIWCAAKRVTKEGVQLSKEERVSVYEALRAMTVYGAYQYGEENEKGTIEEGKLADLIITDRNPLEVPVDEVKDIRVMETIKEGKTVFKRKES